MGQDVQLGKTLDRVLTHYKTQITAKELVARARAQGAKVTEQQLSRFRKGNSIRTDTLENFLKALPRDIRRAYWLELLRERPDLMHWVIQTLPSSQLLEMAAERVMRERQMIELSSWLQPQPDVGKR